MNPIIITAADAGYFSLVQGTILSIRQKPQGQAIALGLIDLGCTPVQRHWLEQQGVQLRQVDWPFDFPRRELAPEHLKGSITRPYLRQYFPGYDLYLWIDADAWVQDWSAVELLLRGASRRGLAVVPELDRASGFQYGGLPGYLKWAKEIYRLNAGDEAAANYHFYPMLNGGVFALRHDAPHWQPWGRQLEQIVRQTAAEIGFQIGDQIALNLIVYGQGLFDQTEILPAWCNWTCHMRLPVWDPAQQLLVEPYLPETPLGIVHLAGAQKYEQAKLLTSEREPVEINLRYLPTPAGSGDYVSPGLDLILPDRCFPYIKVGNQQDSGWLYLRRDIPHNWYVDGRFPTIGFISRDEAHILYHTARLFQGQPALEIGCWLGWSTCHLALAGVQLDVVDPILADATIRGSVVNSLRAAGVLNRVNLIAGYSPQHVQQLAQTTSRRWPFFFIDGDHNAPGPLHDAMICEQFATPDALILFHDLTSPDVGQGLDYLQQQGWQTMVYQTAQIMGVAWRGNSQPVIHQPDPNVAWALPTHLKGHRLSSYEQLPL